MAKTGDEISRSAEERIIFHKTSQDTNGELLEVEVTYKPNSPKPPAHYHPYQEEHFNVLSGRIKTNIGGQEKTYQTGEHFVVPAGVSHWMHNVSEHQGRVLWQIRPALNTETFFETIWSLDRDGKIEENGSGFLQAVVIGQAYSAEFRLTKPPYPLQWLLFAVLAPLGKLRGYRATYP